MAFFAPKKIHLETNSLPLFAYSKKIVWFRKWNIRSDTVLGPKKTVWTHSYYKIFINNSKYLSRLDFIMNNLKKKNNKQQHQKNRQKSRKHMNTKNCYTSTMCVCVCFVSVVLLTSAFLFISVPWCCYAHHHHHRCIVVVVVVVFIQSTIFPSVLCRFCFASLHVPMTHMSRGHVW